MSSRTHQYRFSDADDDLDSDPEYTFDDDEDGDEFDLDDVRPRRAPRRTRSGQPGHQQGKRASRRERARRERTFDDGMDDDTFEDVNDALERKERERRKADISEPFKCRNCRAFIGMPPTGGQQRNHCPMCLYSLHVDGKTPGDRASDCRSLMEPIGVNYRRNMEQVVVHRCLGCGFVRYNRIAADDNPILLAELPIVELPG